MILQCKHQVKRFFFGLKQCLRDFAPFFLRALLRVIFIVSLLDGLISGFISAFK